MYLWRLKRFCVILLIIEFAMRRPFQQCVYRCATACSCWDIALWARRPTLSLLEAEKSVNKGLNIVVSPVATRSLRWVWYCIAENFLQRKISSKAIIRQFVRNLFSSNVGRGSFALRSLYCLSLYLRIHEYLWSHTCGFAEKFSQEINLVQSVLVRT